MHPLLCCDKPDLSLMERQKVFLTSEKETDAKNGVHNMSPNIELMRPTPGKRATRVPSSFYPWSNFQLPLPHPANQSCRHKAKSTTLMVKHKWTGEVRRNVPKRRLSSQQTKTRPREGKLSL